MPDWEELREAGRAVKERVLRHLDEYLVELEASIERAGGQVHWARDGAEANAIIAGIVRSPRGHGGGEGQVDHLRRDQDERGARGRGHQRSRPTSPS